MFKTQCVKEITRDVRIHLKTNENKTQYEIYAAKVVLRQKYVSVNAYQYIKCLIESLNQQPNFTPQRTRKKITKLKVKIRK